MMVSYIKKGNQKEFLNTYSNYSSAVNGFSRDVSKIAQERKMTSLELAGNEIFLVPMDFICSCYNVNKKCKSINEIEKWLVNYMNYLTEVKIRTESNELDEMDLKVLYITQPVFFGHAQTNSQFLYDLFNKKSKKWMIELVNNPRKVI